MIVLLHNSDVLFKLVDDFNSEFALGGGFEELIVVLLIY